VNVLAASGLGLLSGFGPCAIARGAALATITARASRMRAFLASLAYVGGAASGYAAFGLVAGFAVLMARWSTAIYLGVAALLALSGIATLLQDTDHVHAGLRSIGGATLLGFAGSLALSPCCTPFVFAIVAGAAGDGRATAAALAAFVVGHVAPAIGFGSATRSLRNAHGAAREVIAFASGTVAFVLAGYYGAIA